MKKDLAPLQIIQKEYRFGNCVWLHNKKGRKKGLADIWDPRKIDDPYTLYLAVVGNGFSMPIELNSDILDAVGELAKDGADEYSSTALSGFKINRDADKVHYVISVDSVYVSRVKFVHQLQNVYHDITGDELSVPIRSVLFPIVWFSPDNITL